ncbi:MAG: copper transporter [Solirubrobacterales bacterium]
MGYSGRYHAASLAAVFIGLAIGILIGIGLSADVVSTASQELEQSLRSERDAAQDQAADLQTDLDRERQFSEQAYPALVAGKLARKRVAVIELGDVPDDGVSDTADEAIEAVRAAGGSLASVSSINLPADIPALVEDVGSRRFAAARRDPEVLGRLGERIGSKLVVGGALIASVKTDLFAAFNGSLEGVSYVVVLLNPPSGLSPREIADAGSFEDGLLTGIESAADGAVGAERTTTDPTTLGSLADLGIPTVDHVDLNAGKVALVFALTGAQGDFGTKDGATGFLPELLQTPTSP